LKYPSSSIGFVWFQRSGDPIRLAKTETDTMDRISTSRMGWEDIQERTIGEILFKPVSSEPH
jgi:hypothetical protein